MKALLQRVSEAGVSLEGETIAAIGPGLVVLVCTEKDDGEADAELVTLDYGPGFQLVRMSGLIDSLMINTATPIDEENTDVSFAYTVQADGAERQQHLADAIIKDLRNQFEADRPIWENKAHWPRPHLCGGDGPIPTYRKWYAQFV